MKERALLGSKIWGRKGQEGMTDPVENAFDYLVGNTPLPLREIMCLLLRSKSGIKKYSHVSPKSSPEITFHDFYNSK